MNYYKLLAGLCLCLACLCSACSEEGLGENEVAYRPGEYDEYLAGKCGLKFKLSSEFYNAMECAGPIDEIYEERSKFKGSFIVPEKVTYEGKEYPVKVICSGAFGGFDGTSKIMLPATVEKINWRAFYGCGFDTINLPEGLTSIEEETFKNCSNLKTLTIPSSVTSIGNEAFKGCKNLTLDVPTTVTSIGDNAFSGCKDVSLTLRVSSKKDQPNLNNLGYNCKISIIIPENVTSIGNSAFENCSQIVSVSIPNTVTSIEKYAFKKCTGLQTISVPNSVVSIDVEAFYDCENITTVELNSQNIVGKNYDILGFDYIFGNQVERYILGSNIKSIGSSAFFCCLSMTSINIPDLVTSIGNRAFENCACLPSIIIPSSVTSIGDLAFWYCENLRTVVIKATTPPTISSDTFLDIASDAELIVPTESVSKYKKISNYSRRFKTIKGGAENM